MQTAFTDLVGVRYPIVGFNRSPGVVAAASTTVTALSATPAAWSARTNPRARSSIPSRLGTETTPNRRWPRSSRC